MSTTTVINDRSTMSDPKWRAAVRDWSEEQVAAAPPLTEEAVRLVRGAFGGAPDFPADWAEPTTTAYREREAG